jgi:flagellar basal-body rod modification protein FlgD
MTRLPGVTSPTASTGSRPLDNPAALNDLELGDFLDLMIAELQNQDPLNPLENHQLLQQISQIREVGATDKLTLTLDAVLLGQNISSATGLIGTEVRALADDGKIAIGIVDRVTVKNGAPELHLITDSRVEPSATEGELEAGTYRYKVTFERNDGRLAAVELGPITTTGTNGLDAALRLANLPATAGHKTVYRTDATGQGDFHLVGVISAGDVQEYIDTLASNKLSSSILAEEVVREFGGGEATVKLNNVEQVRQRKVE